MNSLTIELLDKVKKEEKRIEEVNQDPWRLKFHLMPPVGWLNDPNGLCHLNGVYHVFFQYSPLDVLGKTKLWGHYTSYDLINWKYEGAPLVPDQEFDRDGVYSGSSIIEKNQIHIFYTGNVKEEGDYDYICSGRGSATIHTNYKENQVLQSKNCVLQNKDYPSNYSCHIRDPKVWKEKGQYYMVLGGRTIENEGRVLLYTSNDLLHWEFCNEIKSTETFGYMWECPDIFQIEGQYFLSISPQGLQNEENRFQNIYQSGYFYLDGEFFSNYQLRDFREWDYGFDFYAPQTFLDEKGRRILIGWMGLPDIEEEYQNPTVTRGWQHALTMLREIVYVNGRLLQVPLKEYQSLRINSISVGNKKKIKGLSVFELKLSNEKNENLKLIISEGIKLEYDRKDKIFSLEFLNHLGAGRTVRKAEIEQLKTLQMFVDTSAIELYLNDGEMVFTTRYYNRTQENSVQLEAGSGKVEIWNLKNMNITYHD